MPDLTKICTMFNRFREMITPSCRCHFLTVVQFLMTSFFSLLPLIVDSAVQATKNKEFFFGVLAKRFMSDSVFIYTSAFIAPFFILTCIHLMREKKESFLFYPIIAILSFYSLLLGSLFYSGVVARELYDFGMGEIIYPTKADLSIFLATFLSWYYCTYKATYKPNDSMDTYEDNEKKNRNKFDKELGNA